MNVIKKYFHNNYYSSMKFRKEYNEVYYLTHKDDYIEDKKFIVYYKRNKKQILDYACKYYQLNADKMKRYSKQYYKKHKIELNEYSSKWRNDKKEQKKLEVKRERTMKQSLTIYFD
jgi:hypothetical protein